MRFLCVDCDEAMSMSETRGPDDGSMTVVFACPDCGRETAMLTNAMETQVVRSLGVSIGGREDDPAPMETVRTQLRSGDAPEGERSADDAPATNEGKSGSESRCPFTGTVEQAYAEHDGPTHEAEEPTGDARDGIPWTDEAEERLERIPAMARPMARTGIEEYAREEGLDEIDERVMDALKDRFNL